MFKIKKPIIGFNENQVDILLSIYAEFLHSETLKNDPLSSHLDSFLLSNTEYKTLYQLKSVYREKYKKLGITNETFFSVIEILIDAGVKSSLLFVVNKNTEIAESEMLDLVCNEFAKLNGNFSYFQHSELVEYSDNPADDEDEYEYESLQFNSLEDLESLQTDLEYNATHIEIRINPYNPLCVDIVENGKHTIREFRSFSEREKAYYRQFIK